MRSSQLKFIYEKTLPLVLSPFIFLKQKPTFHFYRKYSNNYKNKTMNRKLLYGILILLLVAFGLFRYAYQKHRTISTEKALYSLTVSELEKEFASNDKLATLKYQDQTLEIKAEVTAIDIEIKAVILNNTLFASFSDSLPHDLIIGHKTSIKGRFLGYDELLEEFKMDQCSIVP